MIDFISVYDYEFYYNSLVGFTVFVLGLYSLTKTNFAAKPAVELYLLSFTLFILIWLLLGLRPISYVFGDMGNYHRIFEIIKFGGETPKGDVLFYGLMKFCASYLNAQYFFFICFTIYILPFYIALKRWFQSSWFWPFVLMVALFSFYSFGVNGIRNGMGTSIFLLGLSYNRTTRWILFYVAFNIHSSLVLPIAAVFLFTKFKNIDYYIIGWICCLLITLVSSSVGTVLGGFLDDRIINYVNTDMSKVGTGRAGFRLDFLLFGLMPILIGLFYRYKLKFNDPIYNEILAVYITANAFWLLIIRIPFSNRFAYLSWFLYGLVVAYPLIKATGLRFANRYYSLLLVGLFTFSVTFF